VTSASVRGVTESARRPVLDHFRWEGGHADIWRVFADSDAFRLVIDGLVEPWRSAHITRIVGVESRGFLLGGACAAVLGVGFVAIRKEAGLLPGPKAAVQAGPDYRGERHRLRMQRILDPADRVLLMDDWAERGSQALAAKELVEACGAHYVGATLIVDQLETETRAALQRLTSLLTADELGPSTLRPIGLRPEGTAVGVDAEVIARPDPR
jgi:adenine phosphoribosyltransferase